MSLYRGWYVANVRVLLLPLADVGGCHSKNELGCKSAFLTLQDYFLSIVSLRSEQHQILVLSLSLLHHLLCLRQGLKIPSFWTWASSLQQTPEVAVLWTWRSHWRTSGDCSYGSAFSLHQQHWPLWDQTAYPWVAWSQRYSHSIGWRCQGTGNSFFTQAVYVMVVGEGGSFLAGVMTWMHLSIIDKLKVIPASWRKASSAWLWLQALTVPKTALTGLLRDTAVQPCCLKEGRKERPA